jgi:hypothetical protein
MKDQKLLWVGLVFVALAVIGFIFVDFTPSGWAHEHKVLQRDGWMDLMMELRFQSRLE